MTAIRSFLYGLAVLGIIFLLGTVSFSITEKIDMFESFYYVLLTITTVGSFYIPKTLIGKLITMFILFFGIGAVLYIATFLTRILVEGESKRLIQDIKRGIIRMKKLKGHIIVCGYGRTGKHICDTLNEKNLSHVVVEKSTEKCRVLLDRGENVIQGDAVDPLILKEAGIENARCLVATLGDDADNIYLIMTSKEINPKLLLAARAQEEAAVARLKNVGADIVVQPQIEGGKQLVKSVLKMEEK